MTFTGLIVEGLDPDNDRAGWLAARRSHVGGSDVPAILGISNYGSPWSTWAEKLQLIPEEDSDELMEGGRFLEHGLAPWFTHRRDLHVIGAQAVIEHPDDPLAWSTIDGLAAESPDTSIDDAIGLVEFKVRNPGRRWEHIPADLQAQCQWQMYCTGLERAWLVVLMGRRLDIHELDRDDGDIAFMVDRAHRFWDEHVLTGTPPPTDGHDATLRAIAAVYPEHTPDTSVSLDDFADVVDELLAAKAAKSAAEKREKEAKNAICAALGDAEEGTVAGERVVSYRLQHRDGYEVAPTSYRVLRPTKSKKTKESTAA